MKTFITMLAIVLAVGCKNEESGQDVTRVTGDSAKKGGTSALHAANSTPAPLIVRTANVKLIVADTAKTIDGVTKFVEATGGYVSGSNVWREGELLRARLTLRVPSDKLAVTIASIRSLARRVENETLTSEDVTQEYVDLGAQLRNLEATEVELRQLLTDIRRNTRKAAEVLEVHQQLTTIRGEIERTKGRMRYLGETTSMSAISLEIAPDQPLVQAGWHPLLIVENACRALVSALQSVATAAIWILIYVVPVGGMFLLGAALLWKVYRRSRVA